LLVSEDSTKGYWIRRTVRQAIYGSVVIAYTMELDHQCSLHSSPPSSSYSFGDESVYSDSHDDVYASDEESESSSHKSSSSCDSVLDVYDTMRNQWEPTGEKVAIKIIDLSTLSSKLSAEDPLTEVDILQYLKDLDGCDHGSSISGGTFLSSVLTPIEILNDGSSLFIVMPYCEHDLFDELERNNSFSEQEAKYYFRQILNGVSHLHRCGVSHGDLSLENIMLLDDNNKYGDYNDRSCKIIDFGMSVRMPSILSQSSHFTIQPKHMRGKLSYMAPEIYNPTESSQRNEHKQQQQYASYNPFAADIWSLGSILFMLLVGAPAYEKPIMCDPFFQVITDGDKLERALDMWGIIISKEAIDLLKTIFQVDVCKRPTIDSLLDHDWLRI